MATFFLINGRRRCCDRRQGVRSVIDGHRKAGSSQLIWATRLGSPWLSRGKVGGAIASVSCLGRFVAVVGDSGDAVSNGKTARGAGGASWSSCSLKRDGGGAIADGMDGGRRVGGSSGRRDAHRRFCRRYAVRGPACGRAACHEEGWQRLCHRRGAHNAVLHFFYFFVVVRADEKT